MNTIRKFNLWTLIALYLVTIFVSVAYLLYFAKETTVETLDVDESYYYSEAQRIVHGQPISSYRPVGFPLVLSGALFLSGSSLIGAKLLLILISSLRTPLVFILVRKIIGSYKVALLSALGIIVWPTILYYSTTIYSESVSLTLFLSFLCVLPLGKKNSKLFPWILAGLLLGMTIMVHPMYILFTPFALLIVLLEDRNFKRAFLHFCLMFCFAALVIAPWSIKISLQEKSFNLLSTNGPDALAGGLNSKLIEGYRIVEAPNGRLTIVGPGMWTHEHGYLTTEENNLPPKVRNEILLQRLIDWMHEHPTDVIYLELAKLVNLWGFYPMYWSLKERIFFGNIPSLIIFFLGLVAIWKWRYHFRELSRFWTIPLFLSAVALISLGSWRYRLPADVALIILSSMLLISVLDKNEIKFSDRNNISY